MRLNSSGGGLGTPLQYSCLENPHGWRSLVGCSQTWLKRLNTRTTSNRHNSAQWEYVKGTGGMPLGCLWLLPSRGLVTCREWLQASCWSPEPSVSTGLGPSFPNITCKREGTWKECRHHIEGVLRDCISWGALVTKGTVFVCVCVCVCECMCACRHMCCSRSKTTHLFPDLLPHVVQKYFLHVRCQVMAADLAECRQLDFSVGIRDCSLPCWKGVSVYISFKETTKLKFALS